MVQQVIHSSVLSGVDRVISEAKAKSRETSKTFSNLTKDEKNQAIKSLYDQGIPQAKIAELIGISAPAVSQRLKRIDKKSNQIADASHTLEGLSKVASLHDAGFSDDAIAGLYKGCDIEITAQDISCFLRVYNATRSIMK